MSIIQKNVFGDNIIYNIPPIYTRQLTIELQKEIIQLLEINNIASVVIRYEHGGETSEFSMRIANFLGDIGYKVNLNCCMMSEIKRNEFTFQKHPSVPSYALIQIGPIF